MTTAHTPGPWTATRMRPKDRDSDWRITDGNSPLDIGTVYSAYSLRDEREANARLIAAAPSLLLACEALMLAAPMQNGERNGAIMGTISLAIDQARAAIRAAKGE